MTVGRNACVFLDQCRVGAQGNRSSLSGTPFIPTPVLLLLNLKTFATAGRGIPLVMACSAAAVQERVKG